MKDASYLVIPRRNTLHNNLSLASTKMGKGERLKQLNEAKSARYESAENKDFLDWIKGSKFASNASTSASETGGITGIRVLNMSKPEASSLQNDLKDFLVLRDYPLDVIKPAATAGSKADISSDDLWHLKCIGMEVARANGYKATGAGVTVAVMDTGIAESHRELVGKVTRTLTFDVDTWSHHQLNGQSIDTAGHGTHVAGLICGNNVGVAVGAKVSNYLMIPHGQGMLSDFILALETVAADPDVQLVNMSAGIRGYYPEFSAALDSLRYVGLMLVAATGNEGPDQTRSPGNFREVLSVGAIDKNARLAPFSSFGTLTFHHETYSVPDLVAPGMGVYSSIMSGGYEAWDGTSMATPIVSGIASLILEKNPEIELLALEQEIRGACRQLAMDAKWQGSGLAQVAGQPVAAP